MYSPYILRYRYCRHVTLDVFWLKGKRRSVTSKPRFHTRSMFAFEVLQGLVHS